MSADTLSPYQLKLIEKLIASEAMYRNLSQKQQEELSIEFKRSGLMVQQLENYAQNERAYNKKIEMCERENLEKQNEIDKLKRTKHHLTNGIVISGAIALLEGVLLFLLVK